MKFNFWVIFLSFSVLGLYSCGPKIVFEQTVDISNEAWTYEAPINFSFTPPDTSNVYNLLLDIEHSVDFEFQNTYIKINTIFPSGEKDVQSVSLNLADRTGLWKGDCNSKYCEATIALQMNTYFKEIGEYRLAIIQDARINPLPGIKSFTLKLESLAKSR